MRLFIKLFAILLTLVSGTAIARSQEQRGSVCSEDRRTVLYDLLGYSFAGALSIGGARAAPVSSPPPLGVVSFPDFVQSYLAGEPQSALLAYAADNTHICVFLWKSGSREPIYVRRAFQSSRIEVLAKELSTALNVHSIWSRRAIRRSAATSEHERSVVTGARPAGIVVRELSEILFPEELRAHLAEIKHLSIAPILGISALPIALLEPLGDGRMVVDLFSVNFLASLLQIQEGANPWPRQFSQPLIIGNPRPSDDPEFRWIGLDGAEIEARLVHQLYSGNLMLGEHAVRSDVLAALSNSDLIYFAAHGYSDRFDPIDGSFLMLADGRLTAREVQGRKLAARPLVVLSACHTGEGRSMETGIIGIARGFQIAGASNVVMSLWAVDDEATIDLMTQFMTLLKREPPSEALRLAMTELRSSRPNPAHWAAFSVFGNRSTKDFRGRYTFQPPKYFHLRYHRHYALVAQGTVRG